MIKRNKEKAEHTSDIMDELVSENKLLHFQNKLFYRILDLTSSGIVVIDNKRQVLFFNSTAREIFEVGESEVLGRHFIQIVRNHNINHNIDTCINQKKSLSQELFFFSEKQKQLKLAFHPIELNGPDGCILYVEDVTNVKKLEQIRTEFVSNVTHELKTPLTSIRGFVETLRNGAINDPSVAHSFLEIIDIESERLYTLINDILHLSEIESHQKDDNIKPQNVLAVVEEVFDILRPTAMKKNVRLTADIDKNITFDINKYRLKQLLINLVDNGIKYNKDSGSVELKCTETIGKITICVKDTGIGIPEKHHPRIFERFYTVDKSRSRRLGGTGLGLSIVKHIVNLYDGNIYFTSEPEKGTRFVIEFPVSKLSKKDQST